MRRQSKWLGIQTLVLILWVSSATQLLAQKSFQERLKDFNYWSGLCNLQADAGKYDEALKSCEGRSP
ncbi:MAG: hypothetical protein HC852_14490 [Acaryochloridaceae cyanobacterium RU_4_10]|nr:hypothetical protein [Acaryochloridaceae cyanobacterium RU_4_10]